MILPHEIEGLDFGVIDKSTAETGWSLPPVIAGFNTVVIVLLSSMASVQSFKECLGVYELGYLFFIFLFLVKQTQYMVCLQWNYMQLSLDSFIASHYRKANTFFFLISTSCDL